MSGQIFFMLECIGESLAINKLASSGSLFSVKTKKKIIKKEI